MSFTILLCSCRTSPGLRVWCGMNSYFSSTFLACDSSGSFGVSIASFPTSDQRPRRIELVHRFGARGERAQQIVARNIDPVEQSLELRSSGALEELARERVVLAD